MGEPEYRVGDDGIGGAEAEAEKDSAMANQEGNDCDKQQGQGPGLPDQCEPENIVRTRYRRIVRKPDRFEPWEFISEFTYSEDCPCCVMSS